MGTRALAALLGGLLTMASLGCAAHRRFVRFPKGTFILQYVDWSAGYPESSESWQLCGDGDAARHCLAAFRAFAEDHGGERALAELDAAYQATPVPAERLDVDRNRALVHFSRGELDKAVMDLDDGSVQKKGDNPAGDFLGQTLLAYGYRFPSDYGLEPVRSYAHPRYQYAHDNPERAKCPAGLDEHGPVTPADGKVPQVILPGRGIRGVFVGVATVDDVIRAFGCDAFIGRDNRWGRNTLVIDYSLIGDFNEQIPQRSPQLDRPRAFVFSDGKLVRIDVGVAQRNIRTPGGSQTGHLPRADRPATTPDAMKQEFGQDFVQSSASTPEEAANGKSTSGGALDVFRYPKLGIAFAFHKSTGGARPNPAVAMWVFPPEIGGPR